MKNKIKKLAGTVLLASLSFIIMAQDVDLSINNETINIGESETYQATNSIIANGLTIEGLATSMKRDPDELCMWESGGKTPSYTSLEELAYRHFHIPLAVFFFSEPPGSRNS